MWTSHLRSRRLFAYQAQCAGRMAQADPLRTLQQKQHQEVFEGAAYEKSLLR